MIFFYCFQGKPAKWRDFHSATAVGTNMYIFGGRGRSARNMCRFIKLKLFSFWCTVYSKTNESLENMNCYICVVFLGATKANNLSNTKSHFQSTHSRIHFVSSHDHTMDGSSRCKCVYKIIVNYMYVYTSTWLKHLVR